MNRSPLIVLVVEDSEVIAGLLQTALEIEGHTVRVVDHGFTDLLPPGSPLWNDVDVLICDLMLAGTPPVTGLDVLTTAQRDYPSIRRIALTAAAPGFDLYDQAASVAHMLLPKPSELEAILAAVQAQRDV